MRVIVLDTETTGLFEPQACEIAYFPLPDTLKELREKLEFDFNSNFSSIFNSDLESTFSFVFNERFKPNKEIESGAAKITGIWSKDVFDKPGIDTFEFPEQTEIMIGHNIGYDHKVLSYKDYSNPINVKMICTKELAQLAFQSETNKNNKLTGLIEHFYPEHIEQLAFAHGALQDCLFVYLLLYKILERLPKVETYEQLVSLCSQGKKTYEQASKLNEKMLVMPFGKHKGVEFNKIPRDYLQWLSKQDNLSPPLENAVKLALLNM